MMLVSKSLKLCHVLVSFSSKFTLVFKEKTIICVAINTFVFRLFEGPFEENSTNFKFRKQ